MHVSKCSGWGGGTGNPRGFDLKFQIFGQMPHPWGYIISQIPLPMDQVLCQMPLSGDNVWCQMPLGTNCHCILICTPSTVYLKNPHIISETF